MSGRAAGQVTAVVCAVLDERADAHVRSRAAALAEAGLRVRTPLLHRPHVTLGAANVDEAGVPAIAEVAREVAARHRAFPLALGHLGIFPAGGVLWLAPERSAALASLQAGVDGALGAAGHGRAFGTQSDPAHWVPHCTLATRLDPSGLARAVELTARAWRPVRARVEALVVLRVGRPGEELVPLPG